MLSPCSDDQSTTESSLTQTYSHGNKNKSLLSMSAIHGTDETFDTKKENQTTANCETFVLLLFIHLVRLSVFPCLDLRKMDSWGKSKLTTDLKWTDAWKIRKRIWRKICSFLLAGNLLHPSLSGWAIYNKHTFKQNIHLIQPILTRKIMNLDQRESGILWAMFMCLI